MIYDKKIICSNIAYLRTSRKMTQLELAEKLNYSDKAVSKWERGDSVPDIFVMKQIADLFEVSLDYFFEQHEAKEIKKEIETKEKDKKGLHLIIALLSVAGVWLLATIAYIVVKITAGEISQMGIVFVASIPLSFLLMLIFNSIWGKRKYHFLIISGLMWSILAALAYSFSFITGSVIWLLMFIGIPGEIAVILGCGLGIKIFKSKNNKINKKQ